MGTGIEWTDETWNPMTGCTKISAGCDHCYAYAIAQNKVRDNYLSQPPVRDTALNRADPFAPRFWEERLRRPLSWRQPRRVFVNSMSDIFHAHFTLAQIQKVFEVMVACERHQFQILTKRPERALRLASELPWPGNVWIGASVEDLRVAKRVDSLRKIPAHVHFLSAEPLLGPLTGIDLGHIEWVIGGGESGPDHRTCQEEWAIELRDMCLANGVAFFWKQWGGKTPKSGGRLLEGKFWSEYPVPLVGETVACAG